MAANIFGERYVGTEPAWWGLGKGLLGQNATTLEALERADADYEVVSIPFPTIVVDGEEIEDDNDGRIIVRKAFGNEKGFKMGTASKDFTLIQNRQLATILNPLSEKWHVSTFGVLDKGRKVFIGLDMGNTQVGKDEFKKFMLIHNSHVPGSALQAVATNIRVVCQNTLTLALQEGIVQLSLSHSAGVGERFMDFHQMELGFLRAQEKSLELIKAMQKKRMSVDAVTTAINAILPVPVQPQSVRNLNAVKDMGKPLSDDSALGKEWGAKEKDYKKIVENILMDREELTITFEQQNEVAKDTAFTAYNLYNAVTGWADHSEGKAQTERARLETAESTLYGTRARTKANAAKILMPSWYPRDQKQIAAMVAAANRK